MATLGYDGLLYILAFDHRGSFQKKMFGIQGDPTPVEAETISDAKRLIFEGVLGAVSRGADPQATGVLVDEQFGSDIPRRARERGLKLAMPVEKSGQNEFDFDYGEDFGAHIEKFDPDFSKVLVRLNPGDNPELNARQLDRLKHLSDWLHERDRKFLFELLVPATDAQLESVGGDGDRYDAELRPRADAPGDRGDPSGRHRGRRVEDRGRRRPRRCRDARGAGPVAARSRGGHMRRAGTGRLGGQGRPLARRGSDAWTGSSDSRSAARSGGTRSPRFLRTTSRADAAAQIAENYLRFVRVYEGVLPEVHTSS